MFYVYVLLSLKDHKFYIGYTNDLKRRLSEHCTGKNISTKPRLPLKLIYYGAHLSKSDAMRRERYFKTAKGKSSLRQMLRDSLSNFSITEPKSVTDN
jgi:putative endonuclease